MLQIILPIGVSFFTFQAMSYVIDAYRDDLKAVSLLDFAVYLSFFPHLVAGPIVRAREFLPQIRKRADPRFIDASRAFRLIIAGMFKKVVVSSYLATNIVDPVFHAPGSHSSLEVLTGIYGYAFQIYADFSGYTDIAIGIALLLGIKFPPNFNSPYIALSLQDFWRRWHMTLSRFLRDYLYVSLGGNRKGKTRTYVNLMATMLIGGLWHGASWTFVVWGGIHGVGLATERFMADRRPRPRRRRPTGHARAPVPAVGGDVQHRVPGLGVLPRADVRPGVGRAGAPVHRLGPAVAPRHRFARGDPRRDAGLPVRPGADDAGGPSTLLDVPVGRPGRGSGGVLLLHPVAGADGRGSLHLLPVLRSSMAGTIQDPGLRQVVEPPEPAAERPPDRPRRAAKPPRPPKPPRRKVTGARPLSAGQVVIVGLICFAVAALLNASALEDMANRQPLGSFTRDAGRALTKPLVRVSEIFGFSKAEEALDNARGRGSEGGTGEFTAPTSIPATTVAPAGRRRGTGSARRPCRGRPRRRRPRRPPRRRCPPRPTSSTSTSPATPRPAPSARCWNRCSTASAWWPPPSTTRCRRASPAPTSSTGPPACQQEVAKLHPGITVVQFGGNDAQALNGPDGKIYQPGEAGWSTEYARRVGAVMDYLSADGRKLIWVGTPNRARRRLQLPPSVLRDATKQEAAKRPAVAFIDTWSMFQSPSGGYADYVVDDDGEAKLMRANDGFHLNNVGAAKLARAVANEVQKEIVARGGTVGG